MGLVDHGAHHFDRLWSSSNEMRRGGPKHGLLQKTTYRTRIVCAVLLLGATTTTHNQLYLVGIYFLCAVGALLSWIDIGKYLSRNLMLVCLFALPASFLGIFRFVTPGDSFMNIGPVHLSVQGLKSVSYVVLRALCAISITMLLVRSAGMQGVLRGLRELSVPASVVAALQMTFAHIHVLGRTAHAMLHALRARTLVALPLRRVYSATANQGATLLHKSMGASRQIHSAMLARGFEGTFPVVDLPAPMTMLDFQILLLCALVLAGAFVV